ncbi:MAG: glycosyltransferase involved in cell wall biosynthesis [Polaribacter sp.]
MASNLSLITPLIRLSSPNSWQYSATFIPMIIAVNTRFLLSDQMEGIGWYTYELLKAMVAQHPEDRFLFFFDRPFSKRFSLGPNVEMIQLMPPARHPLLWLAWFEWSLVKAMKRYKADVLLSPDGYLPLRSDIKTVMVTHDIAHIYFPEQIYYSARKYYQYFVPKFLIKADAVVTVSEYTKQDILKHYPQVASNKIHAIYNGCRAEFIPLSEKEKKAVREKHANGQEYFFYVGAVQPRKNVHRLISAFDLFKEKTKAPIKLLIGGRFAWQTGDVSDAYNNAIHKSDVHFLGYLSNEEVPKLMGAAYALTYVSLFEGFGLPLVEAMNCEVPFITSNCSSMPEVAGKAGILVDPYELDNITNALLDIYNNKKRYADLVENGKIERERFSWAGAAEQVYQLLNI